MNIVGSKEPGCELPVRKHCMLKQLICDTQNIYHELPAGLGCKDGNWINMKPPQGFLTYHSLALRSCFSLVKSKTAPFIWNDYCLLKCHWHFVCIFHFPALCLACAPLTNSVVILFLPLPGTAFEHLVMFTAIAVTGWVARLRNMRQVVMPSVLFVHFMERIRGNGSWWR